MTLPIPVAPALLPLTTPPAPSAAPLTATEAVAFRDALAVALGEPSAPRLRQRAAGAGEAPRPADARRGTLADARAGEVPSPEVEETPGRTSGDSTGGLPAEGSGGPVYDETTPGSGVVEPGVVAGRRAHRSEGATRLELERESWTPAIVITPVAVPALPVVTPISAPLAARNESRDVLVPEFRGRLERVITRMEQEYGYTVEVIETGRTQERQDALYAQGRTAPGPVVTWTRSSRHTHGLAADVAIDGGWTDRTAFERFAVIAREEGLRTLGPRDPGHIELRVGEGARMARPVPQVEPPARSLPSTDAAPTDDPVGRLFERGQPRPSDGRMSIQPVDSGEVSILPVRTRRAPEPGGMMHILPIGADAVSILPVRSPRSRQEDGLMQILPVDSGDVSILPTRPPRGSAPDGLMHILPATPHEEQPWPITRPRVPDEGRVSILPAAELVPAGPGGRSGSRRGPANIELGGPFGVLEGRPAAPAVAQVAPVATVAQVAATAQVAAVATPGAVSGDSSRTGRAARAVRQAPEGPTSVERIVREAPLAPVVSPREVVASAEQAVAARLWSPPSTGETARPEQDVRAGMEPTEEMFADLLPSFTPDGDAWGALTPEREGVLRPDRADGPEAIERTDAAERIARALRLQDDAGERPVSSVMLRLDHPEGGEDRIRVDLRGRSVGATLDVADANAADHLRAHTRELQQALERAGLEGERLVVRAAADSSQSLASAAGAERDSVRAASTPSGSSGTGASPRDPRSSRESNHSQRDHDQPASRQRRDQGDRR
ncbi:MAG: flagellar hook-length control protein FliK [Gemmatimonadetes bacterium]|nr:flagellar hook-length control protein FliK [Gemmatimonadota bacterium]